LHHCPGTPRIDSTNLDDVGVLLIADCLPNLVNSDSRIEARLSLIVNRVWRTVEFIKRDADLLVVAVSLIL
jgi:hypothetical protein